jgi:HPt (histidine-containing phosphotransfer) domain-containing protein
MLAVPADDGLFDEVQIAMLRDAIGPDELLEMLSDLPPTAATSLAAIADALGCEDIAEARRAAHTLKGCASTFGASGLATIAREIELDLPSIEAMRQRMPALVETLALTAAALRRVAGGTAQDQ